MQTRDTTTSKYMHTKTLRTKPSYNHFDVRFTVYEDEREMIVTFVSAYGLQK